MARAKNGRGQPTKLDPALQGEFLRLMQLGSYLGDVCAALGISYQTYRNWMIWGEEYKEGVRRGAKDRIYFEFFEAVTKGEALLKLETIGKIRQIAQKKNDWRGLAWFAEHRFSDWGKKRVEVTGKDGGPIKTANLNTNVPLEDMTPEDLSDLYAALLREDDNWGED